jgi:hypothetical protein
LQVFPDIILIRIRRLSLIQRGRGHLPHCVEPSHRHVLACVAATPAARAQAGFLNQSYP